MIGILIIAHGTLGESLLHCASHILGSRPRQLAQIGITPEDDPQLVLPLAIRLTRSLDSGSGVLVLTDIFGGTPSNVAASLLVPGKVEGASGVNLPMLIRALTYRNESLAIVVEKALSGGTEGVVHMPPPEHTSVATGT
ncbi:MAG: PTS sugar transporter subunit IIA [Betaproteobacteria bacterium]|nr:MAG: PTS sugar transporter subunit IIA [Betaproteobacteria bacterium]